MTPRTLYVLYDSECGLCVRCRRWLQQQPMFVPLVFVPLQVPDLAQRFVGIERYRPDREIVVVGDSGQVYTGGSAWMMCLWALEKTRPWARRLARAGLVGLVKRFCLLISTHRLKLSTALGLATDRAFGELIANTPAPFCNGSRCEVGATKTGSSAGALTRFRRHPPTRSQ